MILKSRPRKFVIKPELPSINLQAYAPKKGGETEAIVTKIIIPFLNLKL